MGLVFNKVELLGSFEYYHSYKYSQHPQKELLSESQPILRKIWPFARNQEVETNVLSLAETADYLGVSEESARRWCEEGRLQAVKQGWRWSIRLEDLNEFIAGYQNGGTNGKSYTTANISAEANGKESELEWDNETA